uniref:Ig-like domain-containing protein n=1 Tax=Glossina brevipalpis TaxID=37001 RepID=A0A1A9WXY2_9MUSC
MKYKRNKITNEQLLRRYQNKRQPRQQQKHISSIAKAEGKCKERDWHRHRRHHFHHYHQEKHRPPYQQYHRHLNEIPTIPLKHFGKVTNVDGNSLISLPNCTLLLLCHLFWLVLLFDMPEMAQADWLMDCGDCHCKWNSGKKTADCKNLTLSSVPENLSNEVQVLDLSLNRIVYLEENAFLRADLQNLHKLYIRNSSLQQIDPQSFTQLEILIELDLSSNLLRSLQPNQFGKLVKVRAIVLNGNLLENLADGIFQNLKYLHKIELKDNRLIRIGTQVFVNVPLLSQIYLNNNRLNFLRKESFETLKRLTALSLDGNPWNCTCELQVFRDFVLRRNLYTPPTSCFYPIHLRGMLWVEDQPEAFACRPRIIFPAKGASINTSKENVTLVCRVHASPNTHIAWDYNKQLYRSSSSNTPNGQRVHIQVMRDEHSKEREFGRDVYISRLTILGAEKSDEGIYTCIAENAGGKDAVQMSLMVQKAGKRDMLPDNLAAVISLMALGLLSVSVFLAMVTCCIYKRFITSSAAHQHRHHHLDLSGADPMTTVGTVVANHATTTVDGGTDVMLGVVNGVDDTSKYKKHPLLQQQTTLNGGSSLYVGKYTELTKLTDSVTGGCGGVGGVGGVGGGSGGGTINIASPLLEVGIKTAGDAQLGHAEKAYLAQSNEDMHHIKYPHGRAQAEINRMSAAGQIRGGGDGGGHNNDSKLNKGSAEFQPDLVPAYAGNKVNNQRNQANELYSPAVTPGSVTFKTINHATEDQQQQKQQQQQQQPHRQHQHQHSQKAPSPVQTTAYTINNTAITTTARNKYNASAQEYLQAKFGTTRRVPKNQEKRQPPNVLYAAAGVSASLTTSVENLTAHPSRSLILPQRTVCSATTVATPTDNSTMYEYRQPPPPPYHATHRTAGNLLLNKRISNCEDNNKNNITKDQGYRETIPTCYETGRPTIVTASPSLNFPTTTTGYNNSLAPRRQLL